MRKCAELKVKEFNDLIEIIKSDWLYIIIINYDLISNSIGIIIFKGMIPFPFTISLIFLSLAFLTSKLQYHSTYITIAIYSVLGPI